MARRTALELHEFLQKFVFALRIARESGARLPDSVARRAITSISIRPCFVALLFLGK